jgi:penicillin amidase/acyl-homoserine-lactone acylase
MIKKLLSRAYTGALMLVAFGVSANLVLHLWEARHWDRDAALAQATAYEVEIIRDEVGVPHIYGKRDADVAFGLAYAHAQDDFKTMQGLIPFYRGDLGRAMGLDGLPIDYLVGWLNIRQHVKDNLDKQISPALRAHLQAYADGVNYYAAQNPSEMDPAYFPMTVEDLATGFSLQHLLFYGFESHVTELFADSPQRELAHPPTDSPISRHIGAGGLPVGSNAFAVAGDKSSDGATRIIINSHQPLSGPVAWYEAHVKSEEGWDMHGGLFPGSPFVSKGFNPNIGWGVTVNKPDLVDTYRLTLDPDDDARYLLDGQSIAFEKRTVWLKLKIFGRLFVPLPRASLAARHGPAIETDHGTYALRFAGMRELRQPAQWLAMNKARNLEEFKAAMAMQAIVSFNFVYADREGNLYFLHNGRLPERQAGWDWQKYLPGTHSDLIWQSQIGFEAMPQITNPASGYLLSANQTPFNVTAPGDNLSRSDFAPTLGFQTRMTNRAVQGLAMLAAKPRLSEDDFLATKWDKTYHPDSRAYRYVARIQAQEYDAGTVQAEGQKLLQSWSGQAHQDDRAAALAICLLSEEWKAEQAQKPAPDIGPVYDTCLRDLETHFARLDPLWSEVNRLRHGAHDIALGGGPDTLRAIYGLPDPDGRLRALAGDGLVVYAQWDKNGTLSAHAIHNYGAASTRPASPHYDDQAPLFADETFRPLALTREDVLAGPHKIERLPHHP